MNSSKNSEREFPFDKEEFWKEISSHKDFPNKRKRNKLFLLIFILGMFSALVLYLNQDEPTETESTNDIPELFNTEISTDDNEEVYSDNLKLKNGAFNSINPENPTVKELVKTELPLTINQGYILPSSKNESLQHEIVLGKILAINENNILPNSNNPTTAFEELNERIAIRRGVENRKLDKIPLHDLKLGFNGDIEELKPSTDSIIRIQRNEPLNRNWILSLAAGLTFGIEDIKQFDPSLIEFFEKSNRSETFSIGLVAKRKLGKSSWFAGLGIEYYRFFNKYEGEYNETTYNQINQSYAPFYNKMESIHGFEAYHKQQIIDCTLELGRRLDISKSFSGYVYTGLGFNLRYAVNGNLYDQNRNIYSIPDDLYLSRLAPRFFLGASFEKRMNNCWLLSVGLRLNSYRNLSSTSTLTHKDVVSIGLFSGLHYAF